MTREKTIVIVFPPFTTPTSPPLGPAMLKGFVERELPGWRVRVLDLNLWTFENFIAWIGAGRMPLHPEAFPEGYTAAYGLTRGAEAFRGKNDAEFYDDPARYNWYGELFVRFADAYSRVLAGACEAWEREEAQEPIIEEFLRVILAEEPDIVGFSMIFNQQLPVGALLGRLLRQRHGKKVIFGGSCFADSAEHFLKWYPESADLIVAGEGEEALKQALTDWDAPEQVPGAVYFGRDGAVRKVDKAFPKQIDYYGIPDFSDLDLSRYFSPEPVVPLLLSRGCYWRRCTFCVHYRSAGLTYRMHSIDFTIEMLRHFADRGIRHFNFIDEMISPKHFEWLSRGIKEAGLDIAYYALTKPTRDFREETLRTMAESGCKYLLWGLESGSQRVLDLMDKGSKIDEVSWVLRRAYAAGIKNHVFLICGFPTETRDEYAQTLRFLEDHRDCIFAVHRGIFSLEQESPIFEHQARFGIMRSWLIRDTPTGGRWGYEVSSGMSQEEARQAFSESLPLLRAFNPYARYLDNFRDHALLIYDRRGHSLKPEARGIPQVCHA